MSGAPSSLFEYEKLDRTVGVPYGCANEKTLAVMYVLDGEVMLNVLPSYFERIIKTRRNKVYTEKTHPFRVMISNKYICFIC